MPDRNAKEGALFIGGGRQWLWTLGVWLAIAVFYLATARPYFGPNSDAVVYFAGARSFAEGQGYRFTIFPGMPPIGLYPPGLSLMFTPIIWLFPDADSQAVGCLILLMVVTFLGVRVALDLLCRLGVPDGLAALATLSLAMSPHWFLSIASLGSDTPFAVLAWVGGWWWLRNQQSMTLRGLVPVLVILFLAQMVRSAGLALYVGLIAAEVFLNRRRALWSVPLIGMSYVAAGLVRKMLIPPGGVGYLAEWGRMIQDKGGLAWYLHHVMGSVWSFLSGNQLHELLWPWMARLPQIAARYSAVASLVIEIALIGVWIGLLALMAYPVVRRWRMSKENPGFDRRDWGSDPGWNFILILGATIGMLSVVPNSPHHFPRYMLWTSPFFLAALWNGISTAVPKERLRAVTRGAGLFLCLVIASNGWVSYSILRKAIADHALKEGQAFATEIRPTFTQEDTVAASPMVAWIHFGEILKRPLFGNFYNLDLSTTPPGPWGERAKNCTFVITHSMDNVDGLASASGWKAVARSTGGRYVLYRTTTQRQ